MSIPDADADPDCLAEPAAESAPHTMLRILVAVGLAGAPAALAYCWPVLGFSCALVSFGVVAVWAIGRARTEQSPRAWYVFVSSRTHIAIVAYALWSGVVSAFAAARALTREERAVAELAAAQETSRIADERAKVARALEGEQRAVEKANEAERLAVEAQRDAEAKQREERERIATFLGNAERAAGTLTELTTDLTTALLAEQWNEVSEKAAMVEQTRAPYVDVADLPSSLRQALSLANEAWSEARDTARWRSLLDDAAGAIELGDERRNGGDFISAKSNFARAQSILDGFSAKQQSLLARCLELQAAAAGGALSVAAQAVQQAKEVAIEAALKEQCGASPPRSGWDATYPAVKNYLKDRLDDPDSLDMDTCTPAILTDRCWRTACVYRAKNAFGGLVRMETMFWIGRADTSSALDYFGKILRVQ